MENQSYFMEQRHGGLQRPSTWKCKGSSIAARGKFSGFAGRTLYQQVWTRARYLDSSRDPEKKMGVDQVHTDLGSQQPTSLGRPWKGTPRASGREDGRETPGDVIPRRTSRTWATPGTDGPVPKTLANWCRRPMPQEGRRPKMKNDSIETGMLKWSLLQSGSINRSGDYSESRLGLHYTAVCSLDLFCLHVKIRTVLLQNNPSSNYLGFESLPTNSFVTWLGHMSAPWKIAYILKFKNTPTTNINPIPDDMHLYHG